ncbi:MAG: ClpXP protease specificity-enhancing factor SspB [Pseudomonadota bacterium]
MVDQGLNYGVMMQQALRGVMAAALRQIAEEGLPGEHHIYITFDTEQDGVVMPDWLREKYPEQITIVLQHEFRDLEVSEDGFGVNLSFANRPATLFVPFDSVHTFVDPSVEFGLKFDGTEPEPDPLPEAEDAKPQPRGEADDEKGAEVVSLDEFRKH